ncbi:hypothetical protein B0T19DRAFT_369958 [Cercophora scortea]|uniref:Uncharacterized protein n=1 Tax=Cercophora scortea TaxID=314031 RepID=A0AAE0IZE1_9PEZI|nr:hypothetical protein B0T19DRAFT_369958 [Cercophora scortea]
MRTRSWLFLVSPLLCATAHSAINWDVYEYGVVDNFKWSRPFPDDGTDPGGFHVNCRAGGTFHAKMYKLIDLPHQPPSGLAPWHDAFEDFLGAREYAGSWDGVDHKGQDREIVVMDYVDVPIPVRNWIEEQQRDPSPTNDKKWLYGVFEKPKEAGDKIVRNVRPQPTNEAGELMGNAEDYPTVPDKDKIVMFPAGAVYEIAPLWVAKGSKCERELNNLAKYKHEAVDHSVLAWVMDHTKPNRDIGQRGITFRIEAMSVTETEDGKKARLMWERLHRAVKRNERRIKKEERLKAKKELESNGGRIKDEL